MPCHPSLFKDRKALKVGKKKAKQCIISMYGKPHLVERFLRVFIATKTLLVNHLLHCSCSHLCMHPLYAN